MNGTVVLENDTLAEVLESGRPNVTILASANIPPVCDGILEQAYMTLK